MHEVFYEGALLPSDIKTLSQSVSSVAEWQEHIKEQEHGDSVVQADLLGKR